MPLVIYVNGSRHVLAQADSLTLSLTLLQWLRTSLGLTGTKLGCGEGGCGACTVLVSSFSFKGALIKHRALNACLVPLLSCVDMHITTVEGIGSESSGNIHPIQKRLAHAHGSQCGFCTPGFVMAMYALVRTNPQPTQMEMEEALGGNLCRCTGYRPIFDAFKAFCGGAPYVADVAAGMNAPAPAPANATVDGQATGKTCPTTGLPCDCGAANAPAPAPATATEECGRLAPSEPIFPPALRRTAPTSFAVLTDVCSYHRPGNLQELLELFQRNKDTAKISAGNTEIAIECRMQPAKQLYPTRVDAALVAELTRVCAPDESFDAVGGFGNEPTSDFSFYASNGAVTFGAGTTLADLDAHFRAIEKAGAELSLPSYRYRPLAAARRQLAWFAGPAVRNGATVGGNAATGSPISDLNPVWLACEAKFHLASCDDNGKVQTRTVEANDFFLGYRKTCLQPGEVILAITLPYATSAQEHVHSFKQSHRREDDIAIVTSCLRIRLAGDEDSRTCELAALAYGGVAPKTILCTNAAAKLVGQPWNRVTIGLALDALRQDAPLAPGSPGGMCEFRASLMKAFLFKLYVVSWKDDASTMPAAASGLDAADLSADDATGPNRREPSTSAQYHRLQRDSGTNAISSTALGQELTHASAEMQTTGEAHYIDDIPLPPNTGHAALVLSTKARAIVKAVDAAPALSMDGVLGYFDNSHIPPGGERHVGPVVHDEPVFVAVGEETTCVGQVIGVVVAETREIARAAAASVLVTYDEDASKPPIVSIKAAIDAKSFYDNFCAEIRCGDADAALSGAKDGVRVLEGELNMGGQEHFYLETHQNICIPGEANSEITHIASSQALTKHQKSISDVLNMPASRVICKNKRIGGGFGGKECRSVTFAVPCAVAAHALRRPVKLVLERDEDVLTSGHRHAFHCKYRVGFRDDGTLVALDAALYANAGNSLDLSGAIVQRALLHIDGCYRFPNVTVRGFPCKTNIPSNTAFRGFGGPQGIFFMESIIDRVARSLGMDGVKLREFNMYRNGDKAHFGQTFEDVSHLQACWDHVKASSDFTRRHEAALEFNRANRWRKRALGMMPTKFGISFTTKFLNQGGALVHIYTDGTVLVSHGGVEMGQGLHTKMAQVCAAKLGVEASKVSVLETSTDKVPNTSPTAASASSDLYGGAVVDACNQLLDRLGPYLSKNDGDLAKAALAAHLDRVDLSAHGFYATPDIGGFGTEKPFAYFTYGAACTEVEVDVLTGNARVLRSDIAMDLGSPINPALDIGQVEGGFTQGLGLMLTEELKRRDETNHAWLRGGVGSSLTNGPGNYKIPSSDDVPRDLRVSLIRDEVPNEKASGGSKAVGEPPLALGVSAFLAAKAACLGDTAAGGVDLELDSPATAERLSWCASAARGESDAALRPELHV